MSYLIQNILDVIEDIGEEDLTFRLSVFSCPVNRDIENFLKLKAIDFAKKKISITHIAFDKETGDILGYFTLAHKVLTVPAGWMSNTVKRRMDRYGRLDKEKNSYLISAFLLAQIGKNYAVGEEKRIAGAELMDCAESVLEEVQHIIGSGVVYLDSADNEQLIHFYSDVCGYRKFSERVSDTNNTKYLQYLKFLC